MSVYFQKIKAEKFDTDAGFVVKESKSMRLFIGVLALAIAGIMSRSSVPLAVVIAAFGCASLFASTKTKVIMMISKAGFFYYGKCITDWTHFESAKFIDEMPQLSKSSLGISDQFFLAIRYRKEGDENCYERKIALTNTQDKSEEEIMAAISYFYSKSQER